MTKQQQLVADGVRLLCDGVNTMGGRGESIRAFLDTLMSQHRTLQQSVIGMMLSVVKEYAGIEDQWVDLRNEAARAACARLRPLIEIECLDAMPLV